MKMKISRTTVYYTVRRHQEMEQNKTKSMAGTPKATRAEDNVIRVTSLHERRFTAQLKQSGEKMSTFNVRRRLSETGLHGRIAVKKPLLRKQNNVKRVQWAKTHKDWTIEQWNKVFWADESKFEIFRSNRTVYVWWRVSEKAAIPCITPTVKYERDSVMVWGSFTNCKVGDLHQEKGKLNQTGYHSILQHYVIPYGIRLVAQEFVIMQDNEPKHISKLCQRYIKSKEEQHVLWLISWPAQSADLNPIQLFFFSFV